MRVALYSRVSVLESSPFQLGSYFSLLSSWTNRCKPVAMASEHDAVVSHIMIVRYSRSVLSPSSIGVVIAKRRCGPTMNHMNAVDQFNIVAGVLCMIRMGADK